MGIKEITDRSELIIKHWIPLCENLGNSISRKTKSNKELKLLSLCWGDNMRDAGLFLRELKKAEPRITDEEYSVLFGRNSYHSAKIMINIDKQKILYFYENNNFITKLTNTRNGIIDYFDFDIVDLNFYSQGNIENFFDPQINTAVMKTIDAQNLKNRSKPYLLFITCIYQNPDMNKIAKFMEQLLKRSKGLLNSYQMYSFNEKDFEIVSLCLYYD